MTPCQAVRFGHAGEIGRVRRLEDERVGIDDGERDRHGVEDRLGEAAALLDQREQRLPLALLHQPLGDIAEDDDRTDHAAVRRPDRRGVLAHGAIPTAPVAHEDHFFADGLAVQGAERMGLLARHRRAVRPPHIHIADERLPDRRRDARFEVHQPIIRLVAVDDRTVRVVDDDAVHHRLEGRRQLGRLSLDLSEQRLALLLAPHALGHVRRM